MVHPGLWVIIQSNSDASICEVYYIAPLVIRAVVVSEDPHIHSLGLQGVEDPGNLVVADCVETHVAVLLRGSEVVQKLVLVVIGGEEEALAGVELRAEELPV